MYGGYSDSSSSLDYADVWVLSIPSFQWHKAGQPNKSREGHSCNVAGHRQMVIIGGLRSDGLNEAEGDIWPLGLGVFDLSEMVFKGRYDADAPVYTSPEVVKRWYAKNALMAKDISEDVEGLFDRSSAADPSASSVPTPTPAEIRPSGGSSSSGSVNRGAIAGGVVGGVVVLAAVVAGVWTCIRRRRRRRNRMLDTSQPFIPQPLIPQPLESDSRARFEVDGHQTHEKEAQQRHELR